MSLNSLSNWGLYLLLIDLFVFVFAAFVYLIIFLFENPKISNHFRFYRFLVVLNLLVFLLIFPIL